MNTWKAWLHGLSAAIIGAAATAGSAALAAPQDFNLTRHGLIEFGKLLGIPALFAAFAYLRQSPLPQSPNQAIK